MRVEMKIFAYEKLTEIKKKIKIPSTFSSGAPKALLYIFYIYLRENRGGETVRFRESLARPERRREN